VSDSSCLVNLSPASSPYKTFALLHFNEKADLGHNLVDFFNVCFLETCLQGIASPDLGSSKSESGSSLQHCFSCLGDAAQ
jgi:hypothetical protein